ncbi:MAG: DUF1622 domain-containing protein [Phycisphaerales bacterium]
MRQSPETASGTPSEPPNTDSLIEHAGFGVSGVVRTIAEWSAGALEIIGIAIIVIAAVWAIASGVFRQVRRENGKDLGERIRHRLGEGILMGLEFLVAADIIYTVAIELTFRSVGVLACIVLIRTFLSFTLELEISGRWPWQRSAKQHTPSK